MFIKVTMLPCSRTKMVLLEQQLDQALMPAFTSDLVAGALDCLSQNNKLLEAQEDIGGARWVLQRIRKMLAGESFEVKQELEALVKAADYLVKARVNHRMGLVGFNPGEPILQESNRVRMEAASLNYKKAAEAFAVYKSLVTKPEKRVVIWKGLSQLFPHWWVACFTLGANFYIHGKRELTAAAEAENRPGNGYESRVVQGLDCLTAAIKWYHKAVQALDRAKALEFETDEGLRAALQPEIVGITKTAIIWAGKIGLAGKVTSLARRYAPELYDRRGQA